MAGWSASRVKARSQRLTARAKSRASAVLPILSARRAANNARFRGSSTDAHPCTDEESSATVVVRARWRSCSASYC